MNYEAKLEAEVKRRVIEALAEHTIVVKHVDGLYRHWRCQKPGTWCYGFDIVTWPGSFCVTGDMGEYLFQRVEDMVPFMRGSAMSYSYAAEKCVAHHGPIKEWREELFLEHMKEERAERPECSDKIGEIIAKYRDGYKDEHEAAVAMYESGVFDPGDLPNCTAYTFHFLWVLHAIKWFCDKIAEKDSAV